MGQFWSCIPKFGQKWAYFRNIWVNFIEIDKHLRSIDKRKDISKYILIGDFNLEGVSWPDGTTTSGLENKFLGSFSYLNLAQFIDKPTHQLGNTLDLLLCDSPQILSNIHVQEQYEICNSDHFGISFNVNLNCKRLKGKKRKILKRPIGKAWMMI